MDLGRPPEVRLSDGVRALDTVPVTLGEIDHVVESVGAFNADNRAGIEGTLHRISALRNRNGRVIGLTLRVGRAVSGTIGPVRDLVEAGLGVLLLGRPGVGKTTRLREVARVLADEMGKRVIVVDTSNEIAGDGDIPHPAIGRARRMQVPHPDRQHAVMIEAVENHMPEVIIVDEIGTLQEALAARTIAERGVQLVGTAHGNDLANLVTNPTLADLVGGVQSVILGDEEARFRGTQKTVTERKAAPTFDAVVEIVSREQVVVHPDTARSVDALLRTGQAPGELRGNDDAATPPPAVSEPRPSPAQPRTTARQEETDEGQGPTRIYPYAISRDSLDRVIRQLRLPARSVPHPDRADVIVALRSRADDHRLQQALSGRDTPVYEVKKNSTAQLRRLLEGVFHVVKGVDGEDVKGAVAEAEAAARQVLDRGVAVELPPRAAPLRKVQHRVAMQHRLVAESEGSEPQRHLVIMPPEVRGED
ncbi:AAA family ATPase [Ectothiorhodospiraceae bacterium WFHF3C12]|nr:AAA family ATPase [Ectothiorhodospiraceae bacterium WFHF3C12]